MKLLFSYPLIVIAGAVYVFIHPPPMKTVRISVY